MHTLPKAVHRFCKTVGLDPAEVRWRSATSFTRTTPRRCTGVEVEVTHVPTADLALHASIREDMTERRADPTKLRLLRDLLVDLAKAVKSRTRKGSRK